MLVIFKQVNRPSTNLTQYVAPALRYWLTGHAVLIYIHTQLHLPLEQTHSLT